jgi:hypothetical protein
MRALDLGEAHEDGGIPVVVRLCEEDLAVRREKYLLVEIIRDSHGDHVGVRHASLLRLNPLEPDPGELLSLDEETKAVWILACFRQREGDLANVALARHSYILSGAVTPMSPSV